jgi:hypothetical protein
MKASTNSWLQLVASIILGSAILVVVAGIGILNPKNITWLSNFDPTQQYVGWALFSQDTWHWPPGLNPRYGLEISISIVFSDSIPLMALLLKTMRAWLSEPFQYFGLWLLLCLILQIFVAMRIMAMYTQRLSIQIAVGVLLAFSPPMLWRFGLHAGLASHFVILIGIYLLLRPQITHRKWYWSILVAATGLIHFYLLPIVIAFWLADGLRRYHTLHVISAQAWLLECSLGFLALLGCAYLAGYFVISGGSMAGAGYTEGGFNILSFFNSNGWSYLLAPIPHPPSQYDRFNYLGLGNILLCGWALILFLKHPRHHYQSLLSYRWLFLALILLFVIALSNRVAFGPWFIDIPLPSWLYYTLSIVRTPNRLMWSAFYILIFFCLILIVCHGKSNKTAIGLIVIALLQIADTSAGWLQIRKTIARWSQLDPNHQVLSNSFWQAAAQQYQDVRVFPLQTGQLQLHWHTFAPYAAKHHLSTSAVYLARPANTNAVHQANAHFEAQKKSGNYDPNTLYILEKWKYYPHLQLPIINPKNDLLAMIDGYIVLAPNWKSCSQCPAINPQLELPGVISSPPVGEPILFSKEGNGWQDFVIHGFAHPEAWGAWSEGSRAKIVLPLPDLARNEGKAANANATAIVLKLNALLSSKKSEQIIRLRINQGSWQTFVLRQSKGNELVLPLPQLTAQQTHLDLEWEIENPQSPKDLGISDDTRKIAVGLESITFTSKH